MRYVLTAVFLLFLLVVAAHAQDATTASFGADAFVNELRFGGLLHDLTDGYAAVMIFSAASLALAAATLGSEASARERLTR